MAYLGFGKVRLVKRQAQACNGGHIVAGSRNSQTLRERIPSSEGETYLSDVQWKRQIFQLF